MMYRLQEKLKANKPAMGMMTKGGPNLVRHLASAGIDFLIADLMHSRMDWDEASHICAMAKAENVYPFIRIQAHPWGSSTRYPDRHLAVDGMRALTAGAEGVMWSIASVEEAQALAHMAFDWHQDQAVSGPKELEALEQRVRKTRLLMPLIETIPVLNELEQIMSIEGISGVFMACTDLALHLGHPNEYEHPDVLAVLDKAVRLAKERNKIALANTGYMYPTVDGQIGHGSRLFKRGFQMVMLQTTEFYVYVATKSVVDGVDNASGEKVPAR